MSVYFNRTSGPLALTLRDGSAILIVPKGRAEVTPAQDGSSSIVRALQKGLIANVTPPSPPPKEPPKAAPKASPKASPKTEPKVETREEPKVEPAGFSFDTHSEKKRDRR